MQGNLTVYKASAGSGKTFTLTAEYIALLLSEDNGAFRHILAVTFTNKATAEMKERILQKLWDLSQPETDGTTDGFMDAVLQRTPALTVEEVRKKAADAIRAILHDYDDFKVETIDSFFQSLLSSLSRELGLSASFKVDIDDKTVIDSAVDRLMNSLADNPSVRAWVLGYIQERIDENKRWDVSFEIKKLARDILKERFQTNEESLRQVLDDSQRLNEYRNKLRNLTEEATDYMVNAAEQLDDTVCERAGGYETIAYGKVRLLPYVRSILERNPKEPSDSIIKYMESTESWLKKADAKNGARIALAEEMQEYLRVLEDLRHRGCQIINSCALSLRLLNPLRLLNEINRTITEINRENNRFMLARTPLLFDRITNKEDASFVFEKTGTRFRHIMIDEFQDTSTLQWSNLRKLLVENMSAGNSCLLVGDIKQSIYRFRGGDWSILGNIGNAFPNNRPVLRNLDTNYRSTDNIIAFNNDFFPSAARILDEIENDDSIYNIYADVLQQPAGKAGGYVKVTGMAASEDSPERTMEADLADSIEQLHRDGLPYNKMAILVRYNSSARKLLDVFAESFPDIPLISDEAFFLSSSRGIQMIIHALRYLNDRKDTISRTYVIRRYSRDILHKELSWEDIITGEDRDLLPEAFTQKRETLAGTPLYELCLKLMRIFQLEELPGASPFLFSFMDQLLEYLEETPSDITEFLAYWEETLSRKAIPAEAADGVRILTIHKSKGLAFHTVLLPYCDWPVEKDNRDDKLWCEPDRAPYNEIPLLPIPLISGKSIRQSIYAEDYGKEHRQRRIENLNLLYVAFTRAKENLLVWYRQDDRSTSVQTIGDLIRSVLQAEPADTEEETDSIIYEKGVPSIPAETEPLSDKKECRNPLEINPIPETTRLQLFENRIKFQQSNQSRAFLNDGTEMSDNAEYIVRGKLLHRLLSTIRTIDDIDDAIREMATLGVLTHQTEPDSLKKFILKRLESPMTSAWFDGSWELYNECSILSRNPDGTLLKKRPDRVMTRNGKTVVVDFKFGNPKPEYPQQVREYMALLKKMGHKDIQGFIWYMYTGKLENVAPPQS